jgi:penicillin-binding protein 1A
MPSRSYRHAWNRSGPVIGEGDRANVFRRYVATLKDPGVPWWKKGLLLAATFGAFVGGLGLGVFVYALALIPSTPNALELQEAATARPSVVLAAGGEHLTQYEDAFQEWVPLDSIPQHVVDALVATEDRRFYEHGGVDVLRSAAALFHTLRGETQGGSTITQQLSRNLFPEEIGRKGTFTRKLKEIIAALKIEGRHTKRDVLEAYLNTVPFIYNATGFQRAALTYFQKPASALTVEEGALLVGMLKGTSYYDPVRNPERARERRNLVLGLMAEQGTLSPAVADSLQATGLGLNFRRLPANESLAPHFTALVRARMDAWADERNYDLERDGLVIRTTLDLGLQRAAQAAVEAQGARLQAVADVEWSRRGMPSLGSLDAYVGYRDRVDPFGYFWGRQGAVVRDHARRTAAFEALRERGMSEAEALDALLADGALMDSLRAVVTRLETGFVALDPATGDVKAYVGSRDFTRDEYDHVAVAQRQPGSTFKPFVYAAALQRGFSPTDRLTDQAVEVDLGNGRTWRPTNAGSISGAELTLADALAYSKNTITVQLMQELGPGRVALVARRMGIADSELDLVPSLALGTSPVTLLELVSAYGTIANDGERRVPRLVTRVETADGRVLDTFGPQGGPALTHRDARTLLDMLRGVIQRGTGQGVRAWGVRGDLAGKTGTTQGNADGWFVLMHPQLVAGAWVGFNDQRVTFRSTYWGQGGHNALHVVGDFFRRAGGRLDPGARFPDPPQYRQPLDFDFAAADTMFYADFESYYEDGWGEGEFDREAYESVWGVFDHVPSESDEERYQREIERLRRATFADRPLPAPPPLPEEDLNAREEDFLRESDDFRTAEEMLGEEEPPSRPPARPQTRPEPERKPPPQRADTPPRDDGPPPPPPLPPPPPPEDDEGDG